MHPRREIRNKVIDLLKGHTGAGARVVANQSDPEWSEKMPAIAVHMRHETAEEYSHAPRVLKRTIEMMIECFAEGETEAETSDRLDDLADQVETRLSYFETLDGKADLCVLTGTAIALSSSGGRAQGSVTLTYSVYYCRAVPLDSSLQAFDDLKTIHADWKVEPQAEAPEDESGVDAETLVEFEDA